uniref:KTSC domain-containing protein n=1 Tax=Steinernema glaseri TaxID=37863 RepID=A0A1I8AUS9_9BILA
MHPSVRPCVSRGRTYELSENSVCGPFAAMVELLSGGRNSVNFVYNTNTQLRRSLISHSAMAHDLRSAWCREKLDEWYFVPRGSPLRRPIKLTQYRSQFVRKHWTSDQRHI